MAERYYLDTAIWIDCYDNRTDWQNNIGEFALRLLTKLLASKSKIIVSDFLMRELENHYSLDQIRGICAPFQRIFQRVILSYEQKEEAKKISKERDIPLGDAIHAILARDNNAVMVTRDKHFYLLTDICEVVKPEDII